MLEEGHEVVQMALEQPRHFLYRLQLAAHGPGIPAAKQAPPCRYARTVPEVPEQFLDRPRPTGLALLPLEPRKLRRPICRQVFRALKPPLLAPAQGPQARLQQVPGCGLAYLVEGRVHGTDEGKGSRHDLRRCARHRRQRRVEKGFP